MALERRNPLSGKFTQGVGDLHLHSLAGSVFLIGSFASLESGVSYVNRGNSRIARCRHVRASNRNLEDSGEECNESIHGSEHPRDIHREACHLGPEAEDDCRGTGENGDDTQHVSDRLADGWVLDVDIRGEVAHASILHRFGIESMLTRRSEAVVAPAISMLVAIPGSMNFVLSLSDGRCGDAFPVWISTLLRVPARSSVPAGLALALVLLPHGSSSMCGSDFRRARFFGQEVLTLSRLALDDSHLSLLHLQDSSEEKFRVVDFPLPEPHFRTNRLCLSSIVSPSSVLPRKTLNPSQLPFSRWNTSFFLLRTPTIWDAIPTVRIYEVSSGLDVFSDPPSLSVTRRDTVRDVSVAFDNDPRGVFNTDLPHPGVHGGLMSAGSAAFMLPPTVERVDGRSSDVENPTVRSREAVDSGVFVVIHVDHKPTLSHDLVSGSIGTRRSRVEMGRWGKRSRQQFQFRS